MSKRHTGDAIFDEIANDLILGIQTVLLNSPLNAVEVSKLKDDKTEENTFEILQHSDRNINNS